MAQMCLMLHQIRNLGFEDKPNYNQLRKLFKESISIILKQYNKKCIHKSFQVSLHNSDS